MNWFKGTINAITQITIKNWLRVHYQPNCSSKGKESDKIRIFTAKELYTCVNNSV